MIPIKTENTVFHVSRLIKFFRNVSYINNITKKINVENAMKIFANLEARKIIR